MIMRMHKKPIHRAEATQKASERERKRERTTRVKLHNAFWQGRKCEHAERGTTSVEHIVIV